MAENERPVRIVPHDSTIVGVYDPAELQFWCERFGVAPEDIQEAVGTVGPRFDDVEYFLNERFARRRPASPELPLPSSNGTLDASQKRRSPRK